jgi:hypothetical protein
MVKMGTFRGIPVYVLQYSYEYQAIESGEEKMYVFEGKLFYRGAVVGAVIGNRLKEFDEDAFNELRRKDWAVEMMAKVTATAETRPQEEEKPEYEYSEPAAADTSLVDMFLASWRDNIDNEVAKLQVIMEAEICAANKI